MSVKGINPKPKGFCRHFLGVFLGVLEELEQIQNRQKRLQTAETSSEQPNTRSEQPKTGQNTSKVPKSGSKRLLARIWPKTAVSQ